MPSSPVSPSEDLQRLLDEGYNVHVRDGHLIVEDVPYVDSHRRARSGTLVSTLSLAGDVTQTPDTHVVFFAGDQPCDASGTPLPQLVHQTREVEVAGVATTMSFSRKPAGGYRDYYAKMSTYAAILEEHAQAIQPALTARTFAVTESDEGVFRYQDTATAKAHITHINKKLRVPDVAIVGLGGTGAYILDMIAKCPIERIHLHDGDVLQQKNAFRAPGAASAKQLRGRVPKVQYYARRYSPMRRGLISHPEYITAENVDQLSDMTYVFVAVDRATAREAIVAGLERMDVPYVDVGMGVAETGGSLGGLVRTVEGRPDVREAARAHLPVTDPSDDDEYSTNIQIVELNVLNAALAVVRWKKTLGFYRDLGQEYFSAYEIDGNTIANEAGAPA